MSALKKEALIFFLAAFIGFSLLPYLYPRFGYETFTWAGKDVEQYDLLAENLLQGRGYSLHREPPYEPSAMRMPGYPFLLAASKVVSGGTFFLVVLQIFAHGLNALLTYRIGRRFVSEAHSLAASLLFAFHPYAVFMSISLMTETFFISAFLLSIYFLLAYSESRTLVRLASSSLCLGISVYFRPTSSALIFLWAAAVFWQERDTAGSVMGALKRVLLVILIFFALLAPWSLRNKIELGEWGLTAPNDYVFFTKTSARIVSMKEGISQGEARERLMGEFEGAFREEFRRDASYPEFLVYDRFVYRDWLSKKNKEIVKENPGLFLKAVAVAIPEFLTRNEWLHPLEKYEILRPAVQPLRPLYRYWSEDGIGAAAREILFRFSCGASCILSFGLVASGRIVYFLLALLAAIGAYRMIKRPDTRYRGVFLLLIILYFAAVHLPLTGGAGHERYRLPIVPLMLIQAFFGLQSLADYLKNRRMLSV
jgi:4-amino-4-deoxy-L-arabinose transferase-like glycosyltransferase